VFRRVRWLILLVGLAALAVLGLVLRSGEPAGPAAFVQGCIDAGGTRTYCTCVVQAIQRGPLPVKEFRRSGVIYQTGVANQAILAQSERVQIECEKGTGSN
jgi:hypothetical protein